MMVYLNGDFLPEEEAKVSIFDRGFLYGDSLFDTVYFCNGRFFRWEKHLDRFREGLVFLKLASRYEAAELKIAGLELMRRNEFPEGLLRIMISRGTGPRGYSLRDIQNPALVMTSFALPGGAAKAPPHWRVITSSYSLPSGGLSSYKTGSRLAHVLARAQADSAGADEALMVNNAGQLVEGSSSNFFWVKEGRIYTCPLEAGVLPGVTREVVFQLCKELKMEIIEAAILPTQLGSKLDSAFLTASSYGLAELTQIDEVRLQSSPLVGRLFAAYWKLVEREVSGS